MRRRRRATEVESVAAPDIEKLQETLVLMERKLEVLMQIVTAPERPAKLKELGRTRYVLPATPEVAKRARIARAAKHNGMSLKDWVAKYGECAHFNPKKARIA